MSTTLRTILAAFALAATASFPAFAADACKNRGELDAMYCDDNGDLTADPPKDPKKWKNPSTIVFTYTPVEDPAVYENIFKPFTTHLAACLDKKVVFYQVQSNAAPRKRLPGSNVIASLHDSTGDPSCGAGIVETLGGAGDVVVGIDGGVDPPENIGAVPRFEGHRVKPIVKESLGPAHSLG